MRDPGRRGKKRDLRRGLNGDGYSAYRHFDKIHGSFYTWSRRLKACDCESYHACRNIEHAFIRKWTGCGWAVWGHDHAPAHFRRMLNRQHRARCKAELRRAFRDWDWDNYAPPPHAEDADWSWF